ncbi:hypothetical protein MXB_4642 [Myxobolus squamalis]|nr:hypothetical protein MXB_4642 [Myxobolus squamalis]
MSKDFIMYAVHLDQLPIAGTGEFLSTKTYTIDQIKILSMDLRLIPSNIYLIKCKNTATLLDSAALTIQTKQQVADKFGKSRKLNSRWDGFLEVYLARENLEEKPLNFAMAS